MPTPFLQHKLFEINDDLVVEEKKLGPYTYLSIDNFYKNADSIHEMFDKSWVQNWKIHPQGKNFKEYYDCRSHIKLTDDNFEDENKTFLFFAKILQLNNFYCETIDSNIFTWINPPKQNIQFWPHQDFMYNILIYLDKINSGGTALYEEKPECHVDEEIDLRYDISDHTNKMHVIPSVFNRCVIFDGKIPHGAFIEDHSKYSNNNWRCNVVYFLQENK